MSKTKEAIEDMYHLGIPISNEGLHAYIIIKKLSHGTGKRSKKKQKDT